MMDSSEDSDDFVDVPSQAIRGQKQMASDSGGSSSKKVGGGSYCGKNDPVVKTMEEKKKEAARIRKAQSRSKKSDAELVVEREKTRLEEENNQAKILAQQ